MPQVSPTISRSTIKEKNNFISKIEYNPIVVKIEDYKRSPRFIETKNSFSSTIREDVNSVIINEVLPFRIRFTNLGTTGYNVPPIGLAIIGYNNYIL